MKGNQNREFCGFKSPFLANPLGRTRVVENGTGVEILALDFSIFSFSIFSILDAITVLPDGTCARCTNITRIAWVQFFVAEKSIETAKKLQSKNV